MKYVLRICLGIALAIFLAQGCTAPSVLTSIQPTTNSDLYAEVILPTQTCGDYFIVQTMIDDHGPYPMLLDTGAGTTVISPKVSEEINASKRLSSITIDRFRADGSIPCKVQPVDHIARALGIHIEGILAYGVFKGVLLTYDFPQQEIRVRKGSFTEVESAQPGVVNTSTGTRPFVRASTDDGNSFTILLDSGSSRGLTLTKLSRFSFIEKPRPTGARMRINGMFIAETGRLKSNMQVGPLTLRQPLITNAVSVNLAGQRIMRDYIVTFDQINHKVKFSRPTGSLKTPVEFPSVYGTGLASAPREDRLIVRRVFEGSAAQKAGVQVDDEILSINGVLIANRGCEHLEFKPVTGPKQVDYLIQRGEEQLHMKFMTAVLVR